MGKAGAEVERFTRLYEIPQLEFLDAGEERHALEFAARR